MTYYDWMADKGSSLQLIDNLNLLRNCHKEKISDDSRIWNNVVNKDSIVYLNIQYFNVHMFAKWTNNKML